MLHGAEIFTNIETQFLWPSFVGKYTIHGAYGIVKSRSFRVAPSVCHPGHVALPHRGVELRRGLRQAPQGGAEDLAIKIKIEICVILFPQFPQP